MHAAISWYSAILTLKSRASNEHCYIVSLVIRTGSTSTRLIWDQTHLFYQSSRNSIVTADGGAGGDGAGLVVPVPVVHINDTAKIQLRWLDTTTFCQKYGLDDEICQRLIGEKYHRINSLFEEDETQLKELHLEVGHIAELKWAMKKMLLEEYPDIELTYTKGEYAPQISGGTGGAGGGGRERGGAGGTGMAPQIGVEYLHRFSEIRGGTGGLGGAGSVEKPNVVATGVNTDPTPQRIVNIDGMIGTSEPPEVVAAGVNTGPAPQRILIGGQGEAGGPGVAGGTGGVGGATKIPVSYVPFFSKIVGGTGGAGGYGVKQGGAGGVGEANIFPSFFFFINEKTRRQMLPQTPLPLGELEIDKELRELLEKHGFRTAGGLFEAYEQDLRPPDFKRGDITLLKAVLRKLAAPYTV
ncbi:hypothetical protein B0H14DRAFT_2556512 [Mycena olivaceomarginata]|nr:hypothetical protein B0H14DRAFT_2556512 [Mycena olivaceomarginata]